MTDPEIYEMLDRCGLTAADLLTKRKSMQNIVGEIRTKLVNEIRALTEGSKAVNPFLGEQQQTIREETEKGLDDE